MGRRRWVWPVVLAIVAVLGVAGAVGWQPFLKEMARRTLATGPNGPDTPTSVGVPFERVAIESAGHKLDGYLVLADARCGDAPAVLIFHGLRETISRWVTAQRILHQSCVSSLVFDYTGTGNSTGEASFEAVNEDIVAAYRFARERFAPTSHLYVLGHSMGNAPMLTAMPTLSPAPDGVVVGNAFSTVRASMDRSGYSRMTWMVPNDAWNNVRAIRDIRVPVLVVVGDADTVNPPEEGRALFAAANEPKALAVLPGLRHNALHRDAAGTWWRPVLQFVGAPGPVATP